MHSATAKSTKLCFYFKQDNQQCRVFESLSEYRCIKFEIQNVRQQKVEQQKSNISQLFVKFT